MEIYKQQASTSASATDQIRLKAHIVQQYMLVAALYVGLIFLLPPNLQMLHVYHMTAIEYRVILFAIALPSLGVWLAAFIGYSRLQQYAAYIYKTPEGIHFERLARGCLWLAWSLPVTIITPLVLNAATSRWPHFHPTAVILTNYLNLLIPLVAFSAIANASRGLLTKAHVKFSVTHTRFIVFAFIAFGVLYCFLTFQRFDLSSLSSSHNPYFLPIWLMVVTITIPYLYAWFIGILAVYEITLFSKHVQGVLYRQAVRLVVGGLLAVILSSIALQYVSSIVPRSGYLVLDYQVVVTALCRIVGGAGFILLAIGASRLRKIEEV